MIKTYNYKRKKDNTYKLEGNYETSLNETLLKDKLTPD